MLAGKDPYSAYQRVEFDARVNGATSAQLVHICYDQLISALSTALLANERKDTTLKSGSLTRALTSLTALQMGIDPDSEMAEILSGFYGVARKAILESSIDFDPECLRTIREDFTEIRNALFPSSIA
ncbi:MAG: flagellar protein FliS [Novosphingobium sp.]